LFDADFYKDFAPTALVAGFGEARNFSTRFGIGRFKDLYLGLDR
jgi:hypothetical protein